MMRRGSAAMAALFLCGSLTGAQTQTEVGTGAVLRGLDKLNGNVVDITLGTNDITDFGDLKIRLTECRYPAGNPSGDAFAGLEITDLGRSQVVFQGWMIASSPALSAMEHPRYDVWVLRCANS